MPLNPPIRATRKDERREEHFNGIPNRDLTEYEFQQLSVDEQRIVSESGLWDVKPDTKVVPRLERFEAKVEKVAAKASADAEKGGD